MTDRRYGPADWTVDEVLRTHAEHTLQYQLALRVRELEADLRDMTDRYHEATKELHTALDRIEHAPAYDRSRRVLELRAENAQLREELALARRVAELEADDAESVRATIREMKRGRDA